MVISKIIKIFERIGVLRAKRELQRMGYTEDMINENLKDWV